MLRELVSPGADAWRLADTEMAYCGGDESVKTGRSTGIQVRQLIFGGPEGLV